MVKTEKTILIYVLREEPEKHAERGEFSYQIKAASDKGKGKFVCGNNTEDLIETIETIAKKIIKTR